MRKVFSNASNVMHVYAQRTQTEGRSSNCFFNGDKIYSYGRHYLLGEFINDGKAIVINDKGYSVTTSKHIAELRAATRQYKQFFTTQCDLNLVHIKVLSLEDSLKNARKPWLYTSQIHSLWTSMNEYIDYTKKLYIKKDDKYKYIKRIVSTLEKEGGLELIQEAKKKEAERVAAKEARQRKEALQKFMSHEINSFRIGKEDYIRLSEDKSLVETTQGVKIPVKSAAVLYQMILDKKDIVGYNIEGYKVTSLNGHLVIGCHNINVKNMHEVGKQVLQVIK